MEDRQARFKAVINDIDNVNLLDPRKVIIEGTEYAYEYLYSIRMSETLYLFEPKANIYLQIAARGHHVKRWTMPREEYPKDRKGYLKWRAQAKVVHSKLVCELMEKHFFQPDEILKVSDLIQKKGLKNNNHDAQTLEDVICLVFLKHYFADFIREHEDGKVISIVQKTLKKMSERGQAAALKLSFKDKRVLKLVKQALA